MKLQLELNQQRYQIRWDQAQSLSIPLAFNGEQPNHFGVPPATAKTLEAVGFVGDTSRGGSCNVRTLELIPHCNGTHTESVSHIVNDDVMVGDLATELMPATLITVTPQVASSIDESYQPPLQDNDLTISRAMLEQVLATTSSSWQKALIVRTLPNPTEKQSWVYNSDREPPFFTNDALLYLLERGVEHLLVDFPSIDKMYDDGKLSNHHHFWQVAAETHALSADSKTQRTITELIYVSTAVTDGNYLLSLQLPQFLSDAAPSRPIIYPLELIE
ncbi:cyclase family protein [Pleionea sp. CnH1-48]|uniref:cyclase family protein n=1 Tax=Pleionea sp. CnH1-48 TaxID=2954494 RepID=UPI002096D2C8|nr:cyclase family protein [Pleionea sp. CnH1-48]MCO7227339.1 cyclase family protein [Pleionea sp. CnH1-48]